MKSLFGAQDMFEIVQEGYEDLVANPTNAQRANFKESINKECKVLFYIQ